MTFIEWWFSEHWFWSTVLTAPITFAWCVFKGEVVRGVIAFVIAFGSFTYSTTRGRTR